jgi:hypothetical protein
VSPAWAQQNSTDLTSQSLRDLMKRPGHLRFKKRGKTFADCFGHFRDQR